MSESSVAVSPGSGKNLHTWDRTISATLVQDQVVIPGEYPLASYVIGATGVSCATSGDHLLAINSGTTNYVRVRRIWVQQNATGGPSQSYLTVLRTTSVAPSGGTAVTPAKFDLADAAAGCTARTLPSTKGTESTTILFGRIGFTNTSPATVENGFYWEQHPSCKPIIIDPHASGQTGIAIKLTTGVASVTVNLFVEVVETAWLGAS